MSFDISQYEEVEDRITKFADELKSEYLDENEDVIIDTKYKRQLNGFFQDFFLYYKSENHVSVYLMNFVVFPSSIVITSSLNDDVVAIGKVQEFEKLSEFLDEFKSSDFVKERLKLLSIQAIQRT